MYRSTYSDSYGRRFNYPSYGYYDDSYVNYGYYPYYYNPYYYGYDDGYSSFWDLYDYSRYRRGRRAARNRTTERTRTEGNRTDENRTEGNGNERPRPASPPPEILAKALKVTDIDLLVEENAKAHHTKRYHDVRNGKPVVRRGFLMVCGLTFDREYDIDTTDAKIEFTTGKNPSPPKGTQVVFDLIEKKKKSLNPKEWGASLVEKDGKTMKIQIQIPDNCIIGPWNMAITTFVDGKDEDGNPKQEVLKRKYKQDIIILFNPWCKGDDVHMVPEESLKEYILNGEGCVFQGNWWHPKPKSWIFGQFQEGVLAASLYLLLAGFGGEPNKLMCDPVQVTRRLAAMVNTNDDRGVLVGKWAETVEEYGDGTVPWKWASSKKILDQYMSTKEKEPVKYAQCWVFSAVLTTVSRALGIPCRSVTNFGSAHDNDGSNTIDIFQNPDGTKSDRYRSDSVWNYHVWNEAWIARSDLDDKGMSGWQAFDATPQETSDVTYNVNDDFTRAMWTCGPCPVAAVKKGICNVQYDTGFVFSEVNADKIYWTVHPGGVFEKKKVETGSVGKGVYTRDPKKEGNEPWKITHEYKHEEGSKLEREAVKMAIKTARLKRDESTGHYESLDIECKLEHKDNINIGDDVNITFIITNKGVHKRTLQVARITVRPMTYTGETGEAFFVKDFEEPSVLNPKNKGKKLSVTMKMSDYLPHRKEQDLFRIEGRAYIPAENSRPMQNMYEESDFSFDLPALEIKGPRDGTLGETMDFTAGFVNPLNIPLTGCSVAVESSGFKDLPEVPQPDVAPGALYEETFRLETIPAVSKYHVVIFEFNSRELQDIMGRKRVRIDDDEDED